MTTRDIRRFADGTILDVRWSDQFGKGHIENAVNIPSDVLEERIDRIRAMKWPVVICCQSGYRSRIAARILNREGIEALDGGDWRKLDKMLKSLKPAQELL